MGLPDSMSGGEFRKIRERNHFGRKLKTESSMEKPSVRHQGVADTKRESQTTSKMEISHDTKPPVVIMGPLRTDKLSTSVPRSSFVERTVKKEGHVAQFCQSDLLKINTSGPPAGFSPEDYKLVMQLPPGCTLADLLNKLSQEPTTGLIFAFVLNRMLSEEVMRSRDSAGQTPAMICASKNWTNTLQWILHLDGTAAINTEENTALHIAVYRGRADAVACLLNYARESPTPVIDLERLVTFEDKSVLVQRTVLQLAVQRFQPTEEQQRLVCLLVQSDCSMFKCMENQYDCLAVAALSPHIAELLPLLLPTRLRNSAHAVECIKNRRYRVAEGIHLTLAEMVQYSFYLCNRKEKMNEILKIIESIIVQRQQTS